MSYDITFDGSLVDNRDLPQITTSSSLTKFTQTNIGDPNWEFNGPNQPYAGAFVSPSSGDPSGPIIYSAFSGAFLQELGGGYASFNASNSLTWRVNVSAGQSITINARTLGVNRDCRLNVFARQAGGGSVAIYANEIIVPTDYSVTFTVPSPAIFVDFEYRHFASGSISGNVDYVRIYRNDNTGVSITPSTLVNGAQKTGGTAITPTITTVQDGSAAVSGPAKELGVEVKDGTVTKAKAIYQPAAQNTEEGNATVSDSKIITAENTALTVEATGLGGPEKLESGTSIVVEDLTEQTENP